MSDPGPIFMFFINIFRLFIGNRKPIAVRHSSRGLPSGSAIWCPSSLRCAEAHYSGFVGRASSMWLLGEYGIFLFCSPRFWVVGVFLRALSSSWSQAARSARRIVEHAMLSAHDDRVFRKLRSSSPTPLLDVGEVYT